MHSWTISDITVVAVEFAQMSVLLAGSLRGALGWSGVPKYDAVLQAHLKFATSRFHVANRFGGSRQSRQS
jgi:hypothetical protein